MIQKANGHRTNGFSFWLRTGRLPRLRDPNCVELKFNPWHDPEDGRFTFAGTGRQFGAGEAAPANNVGEDPPNIAFRDDAALPQIRTKPDADAWRADMLAKYGKSPADRALIDAKYRQYVAALQPIPEDNPKPKSEPNVAAELAVGIGEGAYGVAKDTAEGVYSALTTDPRTTIGNVEHGISDMIDSAIAAEDTPARVQVSRAADAVANASARDIGRAVGSIAGDAALTIAPGAAAARVSALRRLRAARPRKVYKSPEFGWAKERLPSNSTWQPYNDAATGARPGQAPTLMRTLPDGSQRPVKFDGVEGEYLIDRKWSVGGWAKTKAQLQRQSEALAEHDLFATLEVPSQAELRAAVKLLSKLQIRNIKVRVVKP